MLQITLIKIAFAEWIHNEEISMKKICQEMQAVPGGALGFDYTTINNKLPFSEKSVLKPKNLDIDNKLSQVEKEELILKIEKIVAHAGFTLMFQNKDDYETCLNRNNSLFVVKRVVVPKKKVEPSSHYFLYFIRNNGDLGLENILLDRNTNTAKLYNDQDSIEKHITGNLLLLNEEVYLISFLNTIRTSYWNITFHKSDSGKDFFIASYHKISREDNQSAIGEAVLVKAGSLATQEDKETIEQMVSYLLARGRMQRKSTKFLTTTLLNNPEQIDKDSIFKMWHSLKTFAGTWEGFFPSRQRFENCVLRIDADGKVKMWIHANTSQVYKGIAYRLHDLLVIRYDYMIEIDDYRASIVVDVTGHNGQLYNAGIEQSTLYGQLSPITRDWKPATTRFAMRKMSDLALDLKESELDLYEISLEEDTGLHTFNKLVEEKGLKSYFYGLYKPDLYAGWLASLKKEESKP